MRVGIRHDFTGALQDAVNKGIYHSKSVTQEYRDDGLTIQETMALLKYRDLFAGRDILDVGVGTGRTAKILSVFAHRYVCFDYSPAMVEYVCRMLPDVEVHLSAMRHLEPWRDGSFDFVFRHNNVVDAVSHTDRLETLREIWRVLRAEGSMILSSHNRRYRPAYFGPRLQHSRNPITQAAHALRFVRSLVNYSRVGRLRKLDEEYALLNDTGHNYCVLHYYIDRTMQNRQLARVGFELVDVLDGRGNSLHVGEESNSSSSLM